ncbi:MAG: glycosyltransferase family 4 protein [Hyphomicrobiaceae bacterium]|nr:glycosyltransferase family 4 protein [Hyphomicrobiaceae bacterium]
MSDLRPLKILILTQYFWPENFRINDLTEELAARGHQITVLTGVPNYPGGKVFADYAKNPAQFSSFKGVQVVRIPLLPRGNGSLQLVFNYLSFVVSGLTFGAWKLRGREFDAIFVFMISPITAVLPAILQRKLKRSPLFVWILDLWPETLSAIGAVKSPRMLALVGQLVSYIYRRTDHILVQSQAFIDNVRRYAGPEAKVSYFPGWAEAAFSGDLRSVERAPELDAYKDTFNVIFAGNIGEAQDFPAILDAAEVLSDRPDVRIIVIGDGRESAYVAHEINRRRLSERVVLLGRFPLERMPSFFAGADALLVTLKRDPIFAMTIPGKVQSYLAAGVPLVAMLDGEGARVIDQLGAGLTCPSGNGEGLAAQIRRLRDMNVSQRIELGEAARRGSERLFNRKKLIDTLVEHMANTRKGDA